ncbi:MAG: DUF58 domain-containing protein [Pseudohongiellaceae bacterium]
MSRKRQLTIRQDQFRSRGAFITLEQLLDQRHAAKSLELNYQSRSRLGMAGPHISKIKGRGVDFEEFRVYQPGDDIRTIDWRVTARTGRPFIKVFREEREKPVIVGIDQSHNMFFGSKVAFKSVVAAEAAAIICWTTVDNGDRVGGVVFNDRELELIRPRRSKRSALRLLNTLANYNQALVRNYRQALPENADNPLLSALQQIYRITRPGSNVYLISDFQSLTDNCYDYLHQLAIHNSVTCVFIYDALEENLPVPGTYSITDGRQHSSIDTHSRPVREHYRQQFRSRVEQLVAEFNKIKVPLITLRTDQVVLEQLETWKHKIH